MRRLWSLTVVMVVFCMVFSACAAPSTGTDVPAATDSAETNTEAASTEAPSGEVADFVTWYQYDQNNEDTKSDERVGNEYLRNTMPLFNEAFAGKWNWVNQPKAFDKMATELITAVQAGGEIPDLIHIGSSDVLPFYQNATVQDLTEWAQAQAWYADIDANSIEACTGPDGKLYCIPVAQSTQVVFVWKDRFPDGYPATPEEFMTQAAALKEQGLYAITFFGSTDFGGEALSRFMWTTISSFGGKFDDGQGTMTLNTPENVAAIAFMRDIVANGYAPEIAFAGQFQEEEAFKDASAGSFPTGLFGYRYINPLTAPNGNTYEKGNEEDMLDAIAAGDVYLAPYLAAEGQQPGCNIAASAFSIPTGAANVEAAYDYINWIMSPEQNAAWVLGPGGGFPALKATQSEALFQTPFYVQAAEAVAASSCHAWYGSLERRDEAKTLIVNTIYDLIKADPTADIATALTEAEEEYNQGG